ncbi:L,D-transpeptidase family protein [uncultured Thiodictyon sp.]|uniref:L,D-transpeptidase family protein n=1 Tax=uncultured Thiodictyon sp. TaxID=1846217 RepID=UPI0025F5A02F|nr:L,D-transpeptidase family protein [uncultured Thiodictyon sp.]
MAKLRHVGHLLFSLTLIPALPAVVVAGESTPVSHQTGSSNALLRGTAESIRDLGGLTIGGVPLESGRLLAEFYAARDYRLAWERAAQVEALLRVVEASVTEGLDPADYHLPTLRALSKPNALTALPPASRLGADLQLSDALLRYSYHIRFGRLDPVVINHAWNHRAPIPAQTLVQSMERVVAAADTGAALGALAPQPFFYANLKRGLHEYSGSDALRGLSPIPAGRKLVQGNSDPRVVALRDHLRALGEYDAAPPADATLFDAPLREALMRFQRRFGLPTDGALSAGTLAALNQPVSPAKVEQIQMNLERMRWFYDDLPADYVLVDVRGFMAHVVRAGGIDWSTRVVVGTPEAQTPSFRDEMEHVVFNPTWTVPPSIQKKMRGVSSKFKVVDRRTGRATGGNVSDTRRISLIQGPGPTNALGRVKFIFPNDQAVYLHDTQSKSLFSQSMRAYSHGCVRVQNPLKLAEVILNRPNWNQGEINRVVATNKTRYVVLEQRLPVLLYYLTARADENGKVEFRGDIYGRDQALRSALKGPPSDLRIRFADAVPVVDPTMVAVANHRGGPTAPAVPPPSVRTESGHPAQSPTSQPTPTLAPAPRPTLTQGAVPNRTLTLDEPRPLVPVIRPSGVPGTRL